VKQGKSQGILSELKSLQHQVKGRLAEHENELRELSQDTRLDQLETELETLQPPPAGWYAERQALVDHIEELSRAHALAEARSRQVVEATGEQARRLNDQLEHTKGELLRVQAALVQREAAQRAEQADLANEREQLAGAVGAGQRQLATLQANQRLQEEQRTALLARVQGLEAELQSVRRAQQEQISDEQVEADRRMDEERESLQAQATAVRQQVAELRADRQRVSQERTALLARVGQLEQALQASAAPVRAKAGTWKLERDQALAQMAQLGQALQSRNQESLAERNRLATELNTAREQLAQLAGGEQAWRQLWQERANLQARVQHLEETWLAREAAVAQERALWRRHLENLAISAPL
jgi:chromosome segregation ATPase